MKRLIYYSLLPLFMSFFLFANGCEESEQSGETADLSTNLDSVSYSLGYYYGESMAQEGIEEFNFNNFIAGFRQGMQDSSEPQINDQEMQTAIQQFQVELQQQQSAQREAEASVNIEEGRQYLDENAQREDVNVTASGLQYRVIEEGSGERPTANSTVRVHYRGTLLNGEEFDSSYERGEPAEFPLNRVIPGWTEGVQLMREGATYEFFLPSELAYGNNPPQGSIITPGAVLIFEVELLEIVEQGNTE
ncbi:MAG: FKBP-type peptidyl-prolyl cis-trans isomerase [Balneolaceae bacterium]